MGKKVLKSEYEDRMISTMREIASEFEDEIEIGEIATTHKITIKTVYRILNKYYGNDEKQKFEALLQKQIIRLYEEGVSKSEIGKRFGLSSVSKYIDEYYKKSEKVDYRKINEENERIQRQKDKKEKKEFMLAQKKEIEEQNKEIIRLYENGTKQKKIAEMFGLKRGTVADRINRYYIKNGENRNVMLDKAIIDGLAKGKAQTAIAKEIGKSRKTVSRIINRLIEEGKVLPKTETTLSKGTKKPLRLKILEDELNNIIYKGMTKGKTQKELAKQIGVSRTAIGYRVKKMRELGIEIPDARKNRKGSKKKKIDRAKKTEKVKTEIVQSKIEGNIEVPKQTVNYRSKFDMIENQKLAKMIVNLIYTKKATIEQVRTIGEYYGVDIEEALNSLYEQKR